MSDGARDYRVAVEFGDCDPAGIVWFPNFYRWMDAASRHWFVARGIDAWRGSERQHGIVGTPVVDIQTRFIAPALYGDALVIRSDITDWRGSSFVQRHRVLRGETLLVEGTEVRVFVGRRADGRLHAIEAPAAIRQLT